MSETSQQADLATEQKRRILYEAGKGIQDELQEALSEPMLDLVERAGNFAADDPDALHQAAYFHPVNELPYTILPPDLPQPLPLDKEEIAPYLADFWPPHEQRQRGFAGIHDLEILPRRKLLDNMQAELEAVIDGREAAPNDWGAYVQTYEAEQQRDFISLPAIAADSGRRKYAADDSFLAVERAVIAEHYTYRYPSNLFLHSGAYHSLGNYIMMPLASEADRSIAKKRLRAAAFIIGWIEKDTTFHDAMVEAEAAHSKVIRENTLRAQDAPEDAPKSPVHGFQESVGRAILPLVAEIERAGDAPVNGARVAKVTQLASLGHVGPTFIRGVGVGWQILSRSGDITETARTKLAAIQDRWVDDFHWPQYIAYVEARERGEHPNPLERTGRPCAFAKSYRSPTGLILPSVIAKTTDLMLDLAANIGDGETPAFSRENPYRPWEVHDILDAALDARARHFV